MGAKKLTEIAVSQLEVSEATTAIADSNCVGWGTGLPPEQVLRLATDLKYGHICQKNGLEFDKELQASESLVRNPASLFEFPIASIFTPENLSSQSESKFLMADQKFSSSREKRGVIDACVKAMESRGLSQTMIDDICSVADEMYTNAIFNAPFIDQSTHRNPGVSRQDLEINLAEGKIARVLLAADQNRIMVACTDPFGSLNLSTYLNKIKATYLRGAAATMNFGPGGAGLGSYIIFNTGASMYVGVHPGHATIVVCILPLGMSNRKRALMPKHLHWIQL